MIVTVVLSTLLVLLAINLLRWRRKTFSYFKDLGIPGPKPSLIWGNLWEYHQNGLFRALDKWCKEYGDIFGFYNGDVPMLVVKDLEFLKHVFIKNFSNFTDRGITMRTDEMHPFVGNAVAHAKGSHWKSIRQSISPWFTKLKLKLMMDHITQVGDVFMEVLGKKADQGQEVCMFEATQALTMDYIGRAALGIDNSFQNDQKNPFLVTAQRAFREIMTGPFHMLAHCTTSFGVLAAPIFWLNWTFGSFSFVRVSEEVAKVIELRKKNPELRRTDILQNLIDAEYEEQATTRTSSDKTTNTNQKDISKTRTLSSEEVIINTTVLFTAGFETTATTLCYLMFVLGKYPDVQEKVREEVKRAVDDSGPLDYETVTQKLKYLGQVINETMRIWPAGLTFTTRQAKEDFEYQGIKYKAGTCIMSPTLQIQRDERFFPDPMKFDPDRFSEENEDSFPKIAFQPFGIGPRNCLGMKLALIELAYTVARMTQHFRWELGESQKGEMPIDQYGMVSSPASGPWVLFHRL
ncbi:cytochrome P450, putative [Ixodes scapularis]|uniref:Cytochrome P450, putative n=1 Tax=Ixodes scapularis TaxID=6945 RepID=B7P5I8_IXOSC|nr:cytochrome P450, putative [Ixodes scapularis]|eukprot:XP_002407452.1 cytochrome P450, putative [Ixodes scapularis]